MFRLWGGGHDRPFYEMLQRQATLNRQAAELLHAMAGDFSKAAEQADRLEKLLVESRELVQQLLAKTNSTFLTPLDREDLEGLCIAQGRVPRWILQAVYRIVHYQLLAPRPELGILTSLLLDKARLLEEAMTLLPDGGKRDQIRQLLKTVFQLYLEADKSFLRAVGTWLNEPGTDPLLVLKWKDVHASIETAEMRFVTLLERIEMVLAKYS